MEYYQNREDRVLSRSIRFIPADDKKSTKDYTYVDNYIRDVRIVKMTVKFEKNPRRPANEQIAKLSIDLQKYQVTAWFHMNEGEISPVSKVYSRDQIMGITKSDNDKKVDDPVTQQENQAILTMEKDCYKYMREREEIAANETKTMRQPIVPEKTLFDLAREKFKQSQNHVDDEEEAEDVNDELRPYLEKHGLPINVPLDAGTAKKIKDEAMSKLKERILAKARIIQERLAKQQEVLKQQEELYQKKQEDKNDKELAEIKFRIGILESRSARFQTQAMRRYQELDDTISKDYRMAALKDDKK